MAKEPVINSQANNRLQNIDLTPMQLSIVRNLLRQQLPNTEVWAFGSRIKFTTKQYSDLDLVAFSNKQQQSVIDDLKEAFEESDLPFTVDLFVWDKIPDNFKPNIEGAYFVLQEKKDKGIAGFCKSATLEDIEKNGFVLTPGRYVGASNVVETYDSFDDHISGLLERLFDLKKNAVDLDETIENSFRWLP